MNVNCFITLSLLTISLVTKAHQKLEISPVTNNAYVYTTYNDFGGTRFPSNSMYIVTGAGVILIDTPWDSTQFQPLLDSIEARHHKPVVLCIATHFHDDRTAGLEYYAAKGIATWTSRFTYDLCSHYNEKQSQYYFEKDTVFRLGQYSVETYYPGPGHTPDNIVIWIPELKILYGGCFNKSTEVDNLGNLEHASPFDWYQATLNIEAKNWAYEYVIPGHFGWKKSGFKHTKKLVKKHIDKELKQDDNG